MVRRCHLPRSGLAHLSIHPPPACCPARAGRQAIQSLHRPRKPHFRCVHSLQFHGPHTFRVTPTFQISLAGGHCSQLNADARTSMCRQNMEPHYCHDSPAYCMCRTRCRLHCHRYVPSVTTNCSPDFFGMTWHCRPQPLPAIDVMNLFCWISYQTSRQDAICCCPFPSYALLGIHQ